MRSPGWGVARKDFMLFADRLALAASPGFAIMAGLSATAGDPAALLCSAAHGSALTGMTAMYLIMSVAHLPSWLRLIGRAGPNSGEEQAQTVER